LVTVGRFDEADQNYRRLLQLKPDFQGGRRGFYNFLYNRKRYPEAIEQAEFSLRLARQEGDVIGASYDLTNLAAAYMELQDYPRALAYLQEPEVRYYENLDSLNTLRGRIYFGNRDYLRAVEAYRQVKTPDADLNYHYYYGLSLFNLDRLAEARVELLEAIRVNERAEVWNLFGTVVARQGDLAGAAVAFTRAVELDPENRPYRENLQRARALQEGRGEGRP